MTEVQTFALPISYQAKTIMGLFKTAHMAEIQGYDLWNKKLDKDWQNLHHAITFLLNVNLNAFSWMFSYIQQNQKAFINMMEEWVKFLVIMYKQ